VTTITDEADVCLSLLTTLRNHREPARSEWDRLWTSDGYRRLKRREAAMGRALEDSAFAAFLRADSTQARAAALEKTLQVWRVADLTQAGRLALAYLPAGATIRAKVYLLIKPRQNSFVFDQSTDPAIMLYLDPTIPRPKFENTVAHELHHIGYSTACASDEDTTRSEAVQTCRTWLGAFGEGLAMLAAAGGPDIHPHAVSPPEDRARWDGDMARFPEDLRRVQGFFEDILDGRLADQDSIRAHAMEFFGVQGPWYTVGYKMAVVIEKTEGRAALIASICDPVELLREYNRAAARSGTPGAPALPLWPDSFLDRLASKRR